MPYTQLTPINIDADAVTGADPATVANAEGSWFYCPHPDRTFLYFTNTNAAARNITIYAQKENNLGALVNTVVQIAIGNVTPQQLRVRICDHHIDTAGKVHVSYDAITNLNVALFEVGEA